MITTQLFRCYWVYFTLRLLQSFYKLVSAFHRLISENLNYACVSFPSISCIQKGQVPHKSSHSDHHCASVRAQCMECGCKHLLSQQALGNTVNIVVTSFSLQKKIYILPPLCFLRWKKQVSIFICLFFNYYIYVMH